MVKFYYPPVALLPQANRESVELAGAKCIVAIDEEKQFYNIMDIFNEKSLGIFWKEAAISDQIEHLKIITEDAEALYNPDVLEERVVNALERIMKRGLILFGVAGFEGNAFESTVAFEEIESLSTDYVKRLTNLYKLKRLRNEFPDIKQGKFVEINFFGKNNQIFLFPEQKTIHEIAARVYPLKGTVTGIVAVAQGAANFIILISNLFDSNEEEIDIEILEQMFKLIDKDVLKSPISWFKFDLGLEGLKSLDGWDEIKDRPRVKEVIGRYREYLKSLIITRTEKTPLEKILEEDLGTPVDISVMSDEEIEKDVETLIPLMFKLNELQVETKEISLLYNPPKLLFQYSNVSRAAIGGGMYLLSIDVGKNIECISILRENITWAEYFKDSESKKIFHDTIYDLDFEQDFIEFNDATQLRDKIQESLQAIMKNSELLLGILELESNAFEFPLFTELELNEEQLEQLQGLYQGKINSGKFPHLENGYIKIRWIGNGKEYFINPECIGILDLAMKFYNNPAYKKKYAAGIVCVDKNSTYFYIISNNFHKAHHSTKEGNSPAIDLGTFNKMIDDIKKSNLAPVCWFKITLGIESLGLHPLWNLAYQYDTLRIVLEKYDLYMLNLIRIYYKERDNKLYNLV